MQISPRGLQAITQREGVELHAYRDSVGVWTIGTGHTSAAGKPQVTPGLTITKEQNDQILKNDLRPIEQQFTKFISVPVTQNQYDAIISIVFNVGPKFWHSTAVQRLNAGDIQGASKAIMLWNKPPEIIGRRRSEQVQFNTPDSTSTSLPDLDTVNEKASSISNLFSTIKTFIADNLHHTSAGGTLVAGAGTASQFPHYWPYILGGTVVLAILIWLGFYIYKKETT